MKYAFLSIITFFSCLLYAQSNDIITLWPNKVPGETQAKQKARQTSNTKGNVIRLTDVTNPILTVFKPKTPNGSKAGIIICPGGGYNILAINKEGTEIAEWLSNIGYTAFVLQYTVPNNRKAAFHDTQRAIKWVRRKATNYNINPEKIGLMGFSAGGHLAAKASLNAQDETYLKSDRIDDISAHVNFSMLIYPAYLDQGEHKSLSPELKIKESAPPFFVFETADDPYGNSALVITAALRHNNIPVELHMLPKGGHGYGLRKGNIAAETWPVLAQTWLKNTLNTSRLNNIQVIGSHNSYKIPIEKPLLKFLSSVDATKAKALQYGHVSLTEQLNLGLRNLELDVFHDPLGGYFSKPKGLDIVKSMGVEPLEFDKDEQLKLPGLKMFHVQDIDFRSHHLLFKEGLEVIKQWSEANPKHSPVVILINTKDQKIEGTTAPLLFTKAALDSIDIEIRSVFSEKKLITPDLVRGNSKTLEAAILSKGWPNLEELKGRFLFVLDEKDTKINRYIEGHPSLKNRVLFVNSKEGNPEAAFRIVNNPITDFDYIKELVSKGYMVRTRADANTKEARTGSYERFEKAKASGAQVISTDYYMPSTLFKSQYKVIFNDGTYERIRK